MHILYNTHTNYVMCTYCIYYAYITLCTCIPIIKIKLYLNFP